MILKVGRLPPGSPALSTKAQNTSYILHKNNNIIYHINHIKGRLGSHPLATKSLNFPHPF